MKKLPRRSYRKLRKQVLVEAAIPGCDITSLVNAYPMVSKATIYSWLRKHRRIEDSQTLVTLSPKFVEVSVTDAEALPKNILEKASLIFNDFSLLIEGKLSGTKLVAILKILEERC